MSNRACISLIHASNLLSINALSLLANLVSKLVMPYSKLVVSKLGARGGGCRQGELTGVTGSGRGWEESEGFGSVLGIVNGVDGCPLTTEV